MVSRGFSRAVRSSLQAPRHRLPGRALRPRLGPVQASLLNPPRRNKRKDDPDMFSRFFIDRPLFAAVISTFIVLAGLAAMRALPIAQYPEIAPPVVTVQAVYPGASAQTL